MHRYSLAIVALLPCVLLVRPVAAGQADEPRPFDTIQVTATRSALPLSETPASISIVTGDQLRARLATDLRTALSFLAGVEISPGGDGGPAGSGPALWGLREFDAFLLVVDGVPWGGAFNPALTTLDLHNIDRIEIMRGAAPVMYGATSFVGVIHVIHRPAGEADNGVMFSAGGVPDNVGDFSASVSRALPELGGWRQSISADIEQRRFADELAGMERGHLLYRAASELAGGATTVDVDLNFLHQDPTSPYPRAGNGLDPTIDTDANFHPADARTDEDRLHLALGHRRDTTLGAWATTFALSHTEGDVTRGYLAEGCANAPFVTDNACGHVQDREVTDLYFDTHFETELNTRLNAVWGIDELFGKGEQQARIFSYAVDPLRGNDAPASSVVPILESNELEDERSFFGVYGQLDWKPADTLDVLVGLRLNYTKETREGEEDLPGGPVPSRQTRNDTEPSASIGLAWQAWTGDDYDVTLFADYRDTFKPAAIDFGPEAEADILDPETGRATEAGVKSYWLGGNLGIDVSAFDMTMHNLVVPQNVNGSPGLANAGTLYLKGGEAEVSWQPRDATTVYFAYAHHELRFGDYERLFDGVPAQLRGNAMELSPDDTGSIGVEFAPAEGLQLSAAYAYTGERYLNKRNTSLAESFTVLDATIGYRFDRWQLSLYGRNLTDARDPVSESELGDGQYYRMPARTIGLALRADL